MIRGHALIAFDNDRRAIAYRHLGGISRELDGCVGCFVQAWGGGVKLNGDFSLYIEGVRVLHDRYVEVRNPRCLCVVDPWSQWVGRAY